MISSGQDMVGREIGGLMDTDLRAPRASDRPDDVKRESTERAGNKLTNAHRTLEHFPVKRASMSEASAVNRDTDFAPELVRLGSKGRVVFTRTGLHFA
jgi:hypothetical protein